jgi:hypothetical protein
METKDYNWGYIGVGLIGILFWANVWFNGFFISIMELIILSAIIGLWFRLTGRG